MSTIREGRTLFQAEFVLLAPDHRVALATGSAHYAAIAQVIACRIHHVA